MTTTDANQRHHRFRLLQCWLLVGLTILRPDFVESFVFRRSGSLAPPVPPADTTAQQYDHKRLHRQQRRCGDVWCKSSLYVQQRDKSHGSVCIHVPDDRDAKDGRYKSKQADLVQQIRSATNTTVVVATVTSTLTRLTFPVAAAALRQLATLGSRQEEESIDDNSQHPLKTLDDCLLQNLLDAIQKHLFDDPYQELGNYEDDDILYSQYALSDTLVALASLQQTNSSHTVSSSQELGTLANQVWALIFDDDFDAPLPSPKRAAECLLASDTLELTCGSQQWTMTLDRIYQRLAQGDALGQLPSTMLVRLFLLVLRRWSPTSYQRRRRQHQHQQLSESPALAPLLQALGRRIRKDTIRQALSTHQLLQVVSETTMTVAESAKQTTASEDEVATALKLDKELRTMAYTLIRHELLQRVDLSHAHCTKLLLLMMKLQLTWEDAVVQLVIGRTSTYVDSMNSVAYEETDISSSWLAASAVYFEALAHWRRSENTSDIVLRVGHILEDEVQEHGVSRQARQVNSLLRSAVLLHRQNVTVMAPYVTTTKQLILLHDDFLQVCRASELANLAWFVLRARMDDADTGAVTATLANRLLQNDIVAVCSPKLASRILSTFTDLFALQVMDGNAQIGIDRPLLNQELLSRLFDVFGSYLLSAAALSPADLSSSISAFAKAGYSRDMGIVDCLVEELTQRLDTGVNVRQASQCLWACAKMIAPESDTFVDGAMTEAPAHGRHVPALCHFLVRALDSLTKQDVSQALWSLGRLRIIEKAFVEPLAYRAKALAPCLSMQEIANILWALNKLEERQYDVVYAITRRLTDADLMENQGHQPSPQECSIILHSLAWLDIRDEAIYGTLTKCMLAQIDETSAQSVASVLWAHEAVHISPPQQLLDEYAKVKLGMVPAGSV